MSTPIEFPSAELWAANYLRSALATYGYASMSVGVVRTTGDQVTVRRDGGPAQLVTEDARLGVNVWASTEQKADDLSRRVSALMRAAAGSGQVKRVTQTSGPSPVADSTPRRYMTFELVLKGTALTPS